MTHEADRDAFLLDLAAAAGEDALETLSRALSPVPHCSPNSAARSRLLDAAALPGRLWRFDRAVAELLDLSLDKARALLDRVDDPNAWIPLLPGVALYWVEGGARVQNALRGFMRIAPGVRTSEHEHVGRETVLVLQGACREVASGRIIRPGELLESAPGTTHTLEAVEGGPELLQLSVSHEGMVVAGHHFK